MIKYSKALFLLVTLSFLESLILGLLTLLSRIIPAANTGPAILPLPTSSIPYIIPPIFFSYVKLGLIMFRFFITND